MDFFISVIIPVYNGDRFIEKAINSVCQQTEVHEIVVINDGSTDRTEEKLRKLRLENPIIKVYSHKNQVNKGRSASRNLGIKKVKGDYIAFLDADDFYLNGRFTSDKKIFQNDEACDGVYNAVGFQYYRNATNIEKENPKLNTLSKKIKPENLFEALISGKYGYFHIDGLTLKKEVFEIIGLFNEELEVAEDTDVFWKMALICTLQPGLIDKPIAMRGIHDSNVFNRSDLYEIYDIKMYESLYLWTTKNKLGSIIIERFLERIWILRYRKNKGMLLDIIYWSFLNFKNPTNLFSTLSFKYFPVILKLKRYYNYINKK